MADTPPLTALERARYGPRRGTGDRFVGFWLELAIEARNYSRGRDARAARRVVERLYRGAHQAIEESGASALDDELRDASAIYWTSCLTDPQYSSTLFGMKRLTGEELRGKAANEAAELVLLLVDTGARPARAAILPELVIDGFLTAFPEATPELRSALLKRPRAAAAAGPILDLDA